LKCAYLAQVARCASPQVAQLIGNGSPPRLVRAGDPLPARNALVCDATSDKLSWAALFLPESTLKSSEKDMISRIHLASVPALIAVAASLLLYGYLIAADDVDKKDDPQREQQLKNMKRTAARCTISPVQDRKMVFQLHENAIMRWTNPIGGIKDGAVYIWTDNGRPQAIFKLYTYDNELFSHEWQSLSESPLAAEREGQVFWSPTEPGIKFNELAEAPKPAETALERLRQMKSLAGKCGATYTRIPVDSKPEQLRLLVQPLFRYECKDDKKCLDGALFGFAQGTDPQGLLLFEARRDGDGYKWYGAFARMATGAVTGRQGDKEIYSVEKYDFRRDPKQTFLMLVKQPIPKE
jgi:hypothetical protein